jgi:branched-chain amino acid aminotransferase
MNYGAGWQKGDKEKWMAEAVQLYAVTEGGIEALQVPAGATSVHDALTAVPLGVYSALRTYEHNKFLCLADHLKRTEQSMALLGWDYRLDRPRLRQALHQVCTAYPLPDARVRFDVLAEPARALGSESRLLITLSPFQALPELYYRAGVHVQVAPHLQRQQPLIKTAAFVVERQPYPLGHQLAFEHLLLDEAGRILEGSSSNAYAVRDGGLWTAAAGILEGITRKIILKLAQQTAVPVHLEAVALAEVAQLDELFVSSSSRGLVPVVNVERHTIGDGRPGPITQQLMQAYDAFVAREIRPAI